jgi:metal-responsive CopG/Arc/MetJ family transcriptional regulator
MATVKTAVSLEKSLFQKAGRLARRKKIPRSRLFAEAVKEYIQRDSENAVRRRRQKEIIDSLNACYADGPDEEETRFMKAMVRHRKAFLKDNP